MTPLEAGRAAIDDANRHDPSAHQGEPLAQFQGALAETWVTTLEPEASDALRLAARAHHLERWRIARSTYPSGRAGYLRWRRDQKTAHGSRLAEILSEAGTKPATIARACEIVQKVGLGTNPEVQTFEDAVCLTFIETQFGTTRAKLDRDRMVEVVAKTVKKMSPSGRAASSTIELGSDDAALLAEGAARAIE